MNYHILVDISCRDPVSGTDTWESIRTWDNGVKAAWVEADVYLPLPGSGPMEVTSLALKVVRLPPVQNSTECPTTGNSTSGGSLPTRVGHKLEQGEWQVIAALHLYTSAITAAMHA